MSGATVARCAAAGGHRDHADHEPQACPASVMYRPERYATCTADCAADCGACKGNPPTHLTEGA